MVQFVLWDIDHTLVATRGVGRALFGAAFREATGTDMERQAAVDGMTDATIFRETAALHGLDPTRADFETFAAALAEQHLRHAPRIREQGHALPGAAAALSSVASLTGVTQTVVTGNVRGAAEIKLRVFGLDSQIDWRVGAYGEDADERADLVRICLKKAGDARGAPVLPEEVVLIGDTPSDVEAGLTNGVHTVAVASGRSGADALRGVGAGAVLEDLVDTEALVKLLQGLD